MTARRVLVSTTVLAMAAAAGQLFGVWTVLP